MKKNIKIASLLLCLLVTSNSVANQLKNVLLTSLPENIVGEWYNNTGNSNYNGMLIHKDFIEFDYRAFMYQEIKKISTNHYTFSAKDLLGNTLNGEIKVESNTKIQLKRGNNPFQTYVLLDSPKDSERVTIAEVPQVLKTAWFTTDGTNKLEFNLEDEKLDFRGESYQIEEIVNFKSNGNNEYRFIVKNNKTYWMFYFKNWSEAYLQVGFNGKMGDIYKANKAYPDERIDDVAEYMASTVPHEIRGNWLKTDGTNQWSHSFYYNFAVLNKAKWNYKSIKNKRNKYVITLERNGVEKVLYAQPNANNTVGFGTNKKQLQVCSLEKTNTPNIKLNEDITTISDDPILKVGTATYSGIIKNFNKHTSERTGMASVNNIFTGDQDSYIIKIQEDGSFSVSFPCYHLQQIYVKFPNSYSAIYVAPGKITWQLLNSSNREEGFFAGDLAQLNTDVASLNFLVFDQDYYHLSRNIANLTPQEYKAACFALQKQQISKLDSIAKTRFLSRNAYQTMRTELTYRAYENALSYDMYKRTLYKDSANVNATYINFITPNILNNKNAIVSSSYNSLINRLKFLRHLREGISVTHPNLIELAKIVKDKGVALTQDEQDLIDTYKNYFKENEEAINRQETFNEKHKDITLKIGSKYSTIYSKMTEDERKKYFTVDLSLDNLAAYAKSNGLDIVFTAEEKEFQKNSKNLLTKEEKERLKLFNSEENGKRTGAFNAKYKSYVDDYISNEFKRKGIEKVRENLGNNFSTDIIIAQQILDTLSRNYISLSEEEIQDAKKEISDPFIAEIIAIENNKLLAKIEANKSKTGFVVNDTPKTEADKVFETIISKYKGKVVFVDFWATWCGPCRSGMKRIMPLKEELKDKDVVFVYITNPSSPEKTYTNMIPNIKGEHYRVSQDEWNYLGQKFNISGIPHYLLIDKQGTVVKRNTSDLRRPESLKLIFNEYL